MTIAIKICGLKDEASLRVAVEAGANYVGFVFFPVSPRHVTLAKAAELKALLPADVKSVMVLVDADDTLLADIEALVKPDFVQLHGAETPERVRAIRALVPGSKVIKALKIRHSDDVAAAAAFKDVADVLLFDAKAPDDLLPGGNGLAFDWALLKGREFTLPWALSGGLNVENVARGLAQTGAKMVDVSSGVEIEPGVKDAALIQDFVKAVRAYDKK